MHVISKNIDFCFIKFPIIFPLLYGFILFLFPSFENYLIFFTIVLLAEPHFGATWPFFLYKKNNIFIKNDKFFLILLPLLIVFFSLLGFIFFKNFFLLIFFAFNIYHVTRQSTGILKMYSENLFELQFQNYLLYFFNIIFFIIGYLRFYVPIINADHLIFLNLILIIFILFSILVNFIKFRKSNNYFTFVTGILIFYPICFVENPVHSILMGVTMHFSQYIAMTYKVVKKRNIIEGVLSSKNFFYLIIFYGLLMGILSLTTKAQFLSIHHLIVIPIIFQMLHFYIDSRLWKFSNAHNREHVLKHLKSGW